MTYDDDWRAEHDAAGCPGCSGCEPETREVETVRVPPVRPEDFTAEALRRMGVE